LEREGMPGGAAFTTKTLLKRENQEIEGVKRCFAK
jgi:hypothetical protein